MNSGGFRDTDVMSVMHARSRPRNAPDSDICRNPVLGDYYRRAVSRIIDGV